MPELNPGEYNAQVDRYSMAEWVNKNHGNYKDKHNQLIEGFNQKKKGEEKKEDSWIWYAGALNALAQVLFIELPFDFCFKDFARTRSVNIDKAELFKAAFCHLLAAKLLHANLCS